MTDSLPVARAAPLGPAQQSALVNLVRRAARTEVMPRFHGTARIAAAAKSGPRDLVTEADHAAEAMIARGLQRMFPHALIVGEEAVAARPALRDAVGGAELAIIIDPVDGTWNFVHGLPLFGMIVAVTRYGSPVLGLLHDPVTDSWIIADETRPARLVAANGTGRAVATSGGGPVEELHGYVHAALMDAARQTALYPLLAALGQATALCCSCHEYRLLAQGAVDFILSDRLNPWDHAAGVLICRRAGGVARMLDGRDYDTAITEGLLLCAASEATWQTLRDHLAPLLRGAGP